MSQEQIEIVPSNLAQQEVAQCSERPSSEIATRCDDIPPPADPEEEWRHTIPLIEEELTVLEPALPVEE